MNFPAVDLKRRARKKALGFMRFILFLSVAQIRKRMGPPWTSHYKLPQSLIVLKSCRNLYTIRRYSSSNKEFIERGSTYLPAYDAKVKHFEHSKFGTEVLQVCRRSSCSDENRVFVIGFPTYPSSNNGVAHVLEHVVLCGSQKYPVRDPFFKMLNRSLATYMNAWTFPDMTLYPFSTMNLQVSSYVSFFYMISFLV